MMLRSIQSSKRILSTFQHRSIARNYATPIQGRILFPDNDRQPLSRSRFMSSRSSADEHVEAITELYATAKDEVKISCFHHGVSKKLI